ncbi:MAG TPA: hypothetical protein VGG33_18995 [Polyangia bacterium]
MSKRSVSPARLKLVQVGTGSILLVRLASADPRVPKAALARMRTLVADEFLSYDGAIFRVSHNMAIERVYKLCVERCDVSYDPNLLAELPAAPNPWPIPTLPVRLPEQRPQVFMARVWHPEMAESLAFQIPGKPGDFVRDDLEMDFDRELGSAKRWRIQRKDLDRVPVSVVADHYEPRVHDILDRHYDCWWDEFLAGDEWSVLPHPHPTQYPVRGLTEQDFLTLEVQPYGAIDEINLAYREKKEDYLNLRIPAEEWMDIDVAYQRIRRHHFPREAELPEAVVAPTEVLLRLRTLLPDKQDQVRWFHGFSWALGGIPADLVGDDLGRERLLRYLRMVPALLPGMARDG